MNFYSERFEVDRRTVLALLAASSASVPVSSGSAVASGESVLEGEDGPADEPGTYLVEQGDEQYEPTALSTGELIEEFYGFGDDGEPRSNTTTGIEKEGVSNLFFWEDGEGVSLVVLNDEPGASDGGELRYEFDELPDDGEWVVRDTDVIPPEDGNGTFGTTEAEWNWSAGNTSGGAYRGGFDGDEPLSVELFGADADLWFSEVKVGPQGLPVVSAGRVFVSDWDWEYNLYAFDADDGTRLWSRTEMQAGGLNSDGEYVYVNTWDGYVYSLHAADGTTRWRTEFHRYPRYPPMHYEESVYATLRSSLHALDREDGTEKWSLQFDSRLQDGPTLENGVIYLITSGFPANTVHAIDANDGSEKWTFRLDERSRGSPAVSDGTVYIPGRDHVYAIDASDGTERWRFTPDYFPHGLTVSGETIFTIYRQFREGGFLHAVDTEDGTERWRFEIDYEQAYTPGVATEDHTVYLTQWGEILGLDVADGTIKWQYEANDLGSEGVTISNGVGYMNQWSDPPGVRAISLKPMDWHLLSGNAESPNRTSLDPHMPASIHPPGSQRGCPKNSLVPDGEERETITLENEATRVEIGARGSTSWQIVADEESDDGDDDGGDGGGGGGPQPEVSEPREDDDGDDLTDVLFEEYFVLEDGDGNRLRSTEMAVEEEFTPTRVDEHEGGYPGIEYEATLVGDLGENEIAVTRSIMLDACQPVHDVEYEVTLLSSDAAIDVTLYQYCDYDLDLDEEQPACGGDRGVYEDGIVRVEPAGEDSDGPVAGFREADGEKPDAFHVGEAPAHEVIGDGSLNEAEQYPEEDGGDPVVIQAWELGSLSTMPDIQSSSPDDSDSMTVRFASADSADELEWLLAEGEPRTLHEVTEVVDVELPPTAVETDEPVPFRVVLDTCADLALFSISLSVEVSRHGNPVDEFDHDDIEVEAEFDDEGLIIIEGEIPEAIEFTDESKGVGYESTIRLHVGEDPFLSIGEWETETYVFSRVDRVAGIAAKPGDVDVNDDDRLTGDELYTALRDRAEFINEHFASEVGSRGEIGFAIEYVTDTREPTSVVEEGWLTLKGNLEDYEEPPGITFPNEDNSVKFMDHALEMAEKELGVDFGAYDRALTVSHILLTGGPKFYMGDVPPQIELGFDGFTVETPTPDFVTPVNARELPSGERIDAIYVTTTDGAWRHEFGHSIGPGTQFGLPDLYPGHLFAVGDIDRWGLMGHGEVMTGLSRAFFGENIWDPTDTWMEKEFETHYVDEKTIEPGAPLTEKTHDDAIQVLFSPFAQFTISVDLEIDGSWPDPWERDFGEIDVDYDVDVEAVVPRLGIYLLETRQSKATGIEFPDEIDEGDIPNESRDSGVIRTSPEPNELDGVALYRFKILEDFDGLDDLKEALDVRDTSRLEEDGFQLSYLDPGMPDQVTLSNRNKTYNDQTLAAQFELDDPPADDERISDPSVTVTREEENLFENLDDVDVPVPEVLEYELEEVDEFNAWIEEQRRGGINHGESIPPLDVMARLPDGRRTGVDPETGEIVEEIPGSRVVIRGRKPAIVTPGFEELTFEVRPDRLLSFLEDHGIETPNWIPYRQRLIVDDVDASVETVEDVPYVDGRTVTEATDVHVVDGPAAPSCVSATLDLDPDRLNVNSGGNFVTGWIGFPESVDPSNLVLESVVLDYVEAITDDQYGWVKNPPVRERGSRAYVQVKFPREEIIEQFGVGEHNPTVTGVADGTTFRGSTTFEVFEPGGGRNNSRKDGESNRGNGN